MGTHFKYTWKIGPEAFCDRSLRVNKPLFEGAILVDLLTGARYAVERIYQSREDERVFPSVMPDTAIQTWPLTALSESELNELRCTAKYVPDENCQPFGDIVFRLQTAP